MNNIGTLGTLVEESRNAFRSIITAQCRPTASKERELQHGDIKLYRRYPIHCKIENNSNDYSFMRVPIGTKVKIIGKDNKKKLNKSRKRTESNQKHMNIIHRRETHDGEHVRVLFQSRNNAISGG